LDGGDNLLQSGFWGQFRSLRGWESSGFIITVQSDAYLPDNSSLGPRPLLLLRRRIIPGFNLLYVPHGPDILVDPHRCDDFLQTLSESLASRFQKGDFCIRYDLPWRQEDEGDLDLLLPGRLKKAVFDVQAPTTLLLDLLQDEDSILSGMKSKTRYNIRLADRKGVRVFEVSPFDRKAGSSGLAKWYEIYRETAERDRITIHAFSYYRDLFDLAQKFRGKCPELSLFLAEVEGELNAGIITARYGRKTSYLYGASRSKNRNYMASYALQWQAVKKAKEEGAECYDFFGIPPVNDPEHPMYGLYRFKTGFGGRIVRRPGCVDFSITPAVYAAFRAAESLRGWYYRTFRKR
jgi:lipid II:glycine glycyltransferase (peptidoglycan interpeptide bridge formation enzyme)